MGSGIKTSHGQTILAINHRRHEILGFRFYIFPRVLLPVAREREREKKHTHCYSRLLINSIGATIAHTCLFLDIYSVQLHATATPPSFMYVDSRLSGVQAWFRRWQWVMSEGSGTRGTTVVHTYIHALRFQIVRLHVVVTYAGCGTSEGEHNLFPPAGVL